MWKLFTVFLYFVTLTSHVQAAQYEHCKVVGVSDGDTLTCLLPTKRTIKVRLSEIDAPEKRQAFGSKSKAALANLTFRKQVRLKIEGRDRYQRTLAIVFDEKGQNVNLTMVKLGMAWAYTKYAKDPVYQAAQRQAQQRKIGLWRDKNPIPPSEFRHSQR